MNNNRDGLFACYNCGILNVTGERSCRHCRTLLYYNCTHCGAWVDNTFSNCPNCQKKLNWPAVNALSENTYNPEKSGAPAVILLVLCGVLLFVVAFSLLMNNSNSARAVSNTAAITTAQTQLADKPQTVDPLPAQSSNQDTSNINMDSTSNPTAHSTSSFSQDSGQFGPTIVIPMNSTTSSSSVSSSKPGSSYLDTVYPNWGRCSGGRCSGYTY